MGGERATPRARLLRDPRGRRRRAGDGRRDPRPRRWTLSRQRSRRAPLTLLLVDDEEVVRDMVSEVLGYEGIEVVGAEDGARGVELFRQRRAEIDLVLLDLSMPGLGGEETFLRLCEIDPEVCVILSSGYDHVEATRRFGGREPAGFIQKPCRPTDLLAEIERCRGRGMRRAAGSGLDARGAGE